LEGVQEEEQGVEDRTHFGQLWAWPAVVIDNSAFYRSLLAGK
jgi:hypothetical protein